MGAAPRNGQAPVLSVCAPREDSGSSRRSLLSVPLSHSEAPLPSTPNGNSSTRLTLPSSVAVRSAPQGLREEGVVLAPALAFPIPTLRF